MIIDSGGGIQCLWACQREQLTQDTIARVEAENAAIEAALGGGGTHDVSRLLRLPGTLNHPNARKRALGRTVTLARLIHTSTAFRTAQEAAGLAQAITAAVAGSPLVRPHAQPRGSGKRPGAQHAPLPPDLAAQISAAEFIDPEQLLAKIEAQARPHPLLRRRWSGDWRGLTDPSRSAKAMALASELRAADFDFAQFVAALTAHPDTRDWVREKRTLDGGRELWRTWSRARTARVDEEAPPDPEPAQGHDRRQLNQLSSDSKPEPDSDPGPQSTGEGSHARERHQRRDAPGAPPPPPPPSSDANGKAEQPEPKPKPGKAGKILLSPAAPLESARKFIALHHMHAFTRTLHHQQSDFFTWDGVCYRVMADEGMRAALYRFLDLALRKDGESVAPFDPDRRKVADVLEATRAEAQLAATVRAPAWLDAEDHYAADEILPCANGLLHMPSRDLLALTPAFFAVNAVVFAYDPDAPEPREWLAFLTSLWPDDQEAISTLQEVFGLMLTAETRYEKILMLVGPKRSGKGTVARILRALRGHASVAGPTLSGLGGHFGMEGLIDKPVAIISDDESVPAATCTSSQRGCFRSAGKTHCPYHAKTVPTGTESCRQGS